MRGSGILLHITSLPTPYGIGTLGKDAYQFVDFLKKAGQKYWQVLPIGPTSYGDSPYQTFSAFAGNPYMIDLDSLTEEKLLDKEEYQYLNTRETDTVDFSFQYNNRFKVLRLAFERFTKSHIKTDYVTFKTQNAFWLDDYALFMAIKYQMPEGSWAGWDLPYKLRNQETLEEFTKNNYENIEFWKFLQYKFFSQWLLLKTYANNNGILLIGDMPIYVAYDSCDVWAKPMNWQIDSHLKPTLVAGVPPDLFARTGQLWGNPIYNYELMEKEGYSWWIKRIEESFKIFDVVRIDHFRGFESYYAIPFKDKTAEFGVWVKGPGTKLFNKVKEVLGDVHIIAEDLGFLTKEVYEMLHDCGYPGMKILQFGFDSKSDSEYAPHNYTKHSVVYPGTHDNMPIKGWITSLNNEDYQYYIDYLQITSKNEEIEKAIIECLKSVCDTAIISMQDYLELGNESRFNIPSTLGGNWIWRMKANATSDELAKKIKNWTNLYRR